MTIFIIEHLEPELWPWCLIEYKRISKITNKNVWFTNIKKKDIKKLEKYGKVFSNSIKTMKLENACILDPAAVKTLKKSDTFEYYIFGGILGDQEFNWRTKEELTKYLNYEKRNIGKRQFSTDNAVYVTKAIIEGKKLKFTDNPEIKINKIESVILPFRYPLVNGKPGMSPEIIKHLKKKKDF